MTKKKSKRKTRRPVSKANKALAKVHGLKPVGRGGKVTSGKLKRVPLSQMKRDREKLTKLSLRETAKVLGVSAGYLSMIENGKKTPGLDRACKIAKYYGYTVEQLWGKVKL